MTNLAALDVASPPGTRDGPALARRLLVLASFPLAGLAAPDLPSRATALFPAPPAVLSLEVPPDLDGAAAAGEGFERFAREHGLSSDVVSSLRVVLDEVLSNVAKYAYRRMARRKRGPMELEACLAERILTITIADRGRPFDPLSRPEPDLNAPLGERPIGGLGVLLVKRLTDAQAWERRGERNVLCLTKRVGP